MAQTPRLLMTLLEVGQKEKEATINNALAKIDAAFVSAQDNKYLGDLSVDPATTFLPGTLYFNTTSSKLRVLRSNLIWTNAA